ncbi:helix-turn-helix transcriptional regulator [Bacillus sp. JJ1127]|uniref:helix-turn-helix domain-containing protein n=1 Tax=Bacillus sp. JJ1127 TaxID=3122952 RepID=UPI002FFE7782
MDIKGEYIKKLRKQKKYTQEDLGRLSGTSASMISKIETGIKSTSVKKLKNIAQALDTPMDDLVN